MRVECKDLERILREQEPDELAALETHARDCASCHAELEAWQEISVAAQSLQHREESPWLWTKIRARLEDEARAETERGSRWSFSSLWHVRIHWQLTAAVAIVLLLVFVNFRIWKGFTRTPEVSPREASAADKTLLTDKALKEAQAAEAAYVQSIDKLAALAQPKLQKADTPLAANYREKLLLLDAAIAECRKQADGNKYNAHLQNELKSLYQDKKQTLEAVLRED